MKTVYTAPRAEVVETETEEMICQSFRIGEDFDKSKGLEILENAEEDNVFEDLW